MKQLERVSLECNEQIHDLSHVPPPYLLLFDYNIFHTNHSHHTDMPTDCGDEKEEDISSFNVDQNLDEMLIMNELLANVLTSANNLKEKMNDANDIPSRTTAVNKNCMLELFFRL